MGCSPRGHRELGTTERTACLPASGKYTLNVVPRGPVCLAQAWSDRIVQGPLTLGLKPGQSSVKENFTGYFCNLVKFLDCFMHILVPFFFFLFQSKNERFPRSKIGRTS